MARTDAGIRSQAEFARHVGVTRSAVSEWEKDKSKPSTRNLGRIAQLTNKGFDWLATGRISRSHEYNPATVDPLAKIAVDRITPDTPLCLNVAAALAYPDGSMTASGLRKEAQRGHLIIERTAGKYYTTLAAITRMRELCRQNPKVRDSGSAKSVTTDAEPASPFDSSTMADIKRAQDAYMIVAELKETLKPASTGSRPRKRRPPIPHRGD
jgi:transcriptional regulator with XRE-family HTH domain